MISPNRAGGASLVNSLAERLASFHFPESGQLAASASHSSNLSGSCSFKYPIGR
jgi:hypothetical protein